MLGESGLENSAALRGKIIVLPSVRLKARAALVQCATALTSHKGNIPSIFKKGLNRVSRVGCSMTLGTQGPMPGIHW